MRYRIGTRAQHVGKLKLSTIKNSRARLHRGSDNVNVWVFLTHCSFYLHVFMDLLLLVVAQACHRLPSLFNELNLVTRMTVANSVFLILALSTLLVATEQCHTKTGKNGVMILKLGNKFTNEVKFEWEVTDTEESTIRRSLSRFR